MLRSQKGLSLLETVIGMGVLVVGALFSMRLVENISNATRMGNAALDKEALKMRAAIVVKNRNNLSNSIITSASALGNNPFRKSEHDNISPEDADNDGVADEGIEIELASYDEEGNILGDPILQGGADFQFGAFRVDAIRLYFLRRLENGPNYPDGQINDVATMRVFLTKRLKAGNEQQTHIDYPISVSMETVGGNSTINSASLEGTGVGPQELCEAMDWFWDEGATPQCSKHPQETNWCRWDIWQWDSHRQPPTLGDSRMSMNMAPATQGMYNLAIRGDMGDDDRIGFRVRCGDNPVADYFKQCEYQFGQNDNWSSSFNAGAPDNGRQLRVTGDGNWGMVRLGGDVNDDDMFYLRMRCPMGTNDFERKMFRYVTRNCRTCMGNSDHHDIPATSGIECTKVTSTSRWAMMKAQGDVNSDDYFFFAFTCQDGPIAVINRAYRAQNK